MRTPAWAIKLAEEVCRDAGYNVPPIVWRRARYYAASTSGYAYDDHLVICATQSTRAWWERKNGKSTHLPVRVEHKTVLLHELAHWLLPGHGHDAVFWRQAWTLFRRYKVPIGYAAWRENSYLNPKLAHAAQRETRAG